MLIGALKKYVENDREFVRSWLDTVMAGMPEDRRIHDIHYDIFEAFIWANKEFGTINSTTAEVAIKERIGKPELSRKLFTRYRKHLADRLWLEKDGEVYNIPPPFDFRGGIPQSRSATIMIIKQDSERLGKRDTNRKGRS